MKNGVVMKSKLYSKLILLIISFSSITFGQYPQMDFPLQIGNLWQYSEIPGSYTESKAIQDTVMPNGLTYTQINGALFYGYFRKEESKVFLYNLSLNDESVVYDFSLTTGDTLSINIIGSDTVVTTVYEEGTGEIFGLQRYYMAFLTKYSSSSAYAIRYVTDGFGFTAYNGEVLSYGLSGAIINGIPYGNIIQVCNPKIYPVVFNLSQNYPNPFNPVTTIKYSVPTSPYYPSPYQGEGTRERFFVTLKVYDVLGNEIETLINEEKLPGNYSVQFDGSNLSSGVYFYIMKANNYTETKKLILLK